MHGATQEKPYKSMSKAKANKNFERLLTIMDELREKCPWDQKQTFQSLRKLTIEETYELCDAITENNLDEVKKELGDLLLHIVFYAKIGSEQKAFDINLVIESLCDKLIRRHPHIYGNVDAQDSEAVKRNWEQIKLEEKKAKGEKGGVLSGVPKSLPAMTKANRIQEKVKAVGFDWENKNQVFEKVVEEINELKVEVDQNNKVNIEQEFGDVLFSLINYARFLDIDPENALEKTNKKFIKRFNYLEAEVQKKGLELSNMSLDEMDVIWNEAKKQ